MTDARIPIDIPGHPTALLVGHGLLDRASGALGRASVEVAGRRVLLACDDAVHATHGARLAAHLADAGAEVAMVGLAASEPDKAMPAVERIWAAALAHGLDRRGLIVAVGGGIVGDLAGFAAATYLRGVDLVQVPTTLLAMVDASIGGKTGVNLTLPGGGLGKNLAGAFWQPKLTIADSRTLATLPLRELRAGLAECVKHAVLDGEEALAALERDAAALAAADPDALLRLIPRSAAVKARIVAVDPLERGIRATLNLGHTFGHAIETLPEFQLLHGEAVAIGLVAAATSAEAFPGFVREPLVDRVRRLLEALQLPTGLPTRSATPRGTLAGEIRRRMGFDKKNEGGGLRLVLPRAVGDVEVVAGVPESAVEAGIRAIFVA
ncbi:MAG: 3-dehydroquinate synthase [Planctomycetaceae bacterium]|jgi:3-dehydroquinate synthase|nr:3-dehydroquinate synthase [Planctomycetaceae bacterium]